MEKFENSWAAPIEGYVRVLGRERLPDGESCLIVPCVSYLDFEVLPPLLNFEGETFACTGWNSDHCVAYFKTGTVCFAKVL